MRIPSMGEIWINVCDRVIVWLFFHSCKHRTVPEIELFLAWLNYLGCNAYVQYGPDQPYKDREA